MPISDTWDWPFLYYAGTVLLKMSPGMFWKITPRMLDLLVRIHMEFIKQEYTQKEQTGFIDQVF